MSTIEMFKKKKRRGKDKQMKSKTISTSSMLSFDDEPDEEIAEFTLNKKKSVPKIIKKKRKEDDKSNTSYGYGPVLLGDEPTSNYGKEELNKMQQENFFSSQYHAMKDVDNDNEDNEDNIGDVIGMSKEDIANTLKRRKEAARSEEYISLNDHNNNHDNSEFHISIHGKEHSFKSAHPSDDKKGDMEDEVEDVFFSPLNLKMNTAMDDVIYQNLNTIVDDDNNDNDNLPKPGDIIDELDQLNLNDIEEILNNAIITITETRKEKKKNMISIESSLNELKQQLLMSEEKSKDISERYSFLSEFLDYMCNVRDCMKEKTPIINRAFDDYLELINESGRILQRERKLHHNDIVVPLFNNMGDDICEEKDEFGRIIQSSTKQFEEYRRNVRIKRKKMKKDQFDNPSAPDYICSDVEEFEDCRMNINANYGEFQQDSMCIMDDVSDEFSNIYNIIGKIDEFRRKYPIQYNQCYISDILPFILLPYIKIQFMNEWNLNKFSDIKHLESMEWYRICTLFDMNSTNNQVQGGNNSILIAVLLSSVYYPMFMNYLKTTWHITGKYKQQELIANSITFLDHHLSVHATFSIHSTLLETTRESLKNTLIEIFQLSLNEQITSSHPSIPQKNDEIEYFYQRWMRGFHLFQVIYLFQPIIKGDMIKNMLYEYMPRILLPFYSYIIEACLYQMTKHTDMLVCAMEMKLLLSMTGLFSQLLSFLQHPLLTDTDYLNKFLTLIIGDREFVGELKVPAIQLYQIIVTMQKLLPKVQR